MNIEALVIELSKDPFNPQLNFAVATQYEGINQTASAVSFYLRTAEYGEGVLVYSSLLRLSRCFEDQNDRVHTVSNAILQAVAYMPERPEAYFMMSQFHERQGNWQECYTWAELGLAVCKEKEFDRLPADVGYHASYVLEFEKAVSSWWIGRRDESLALLNKLTDMSISQEYVDAVKHNLERINAAI